MPVEVLLRVTRTRPSSRLRRETKVINPSTKKPGEKKKTGHWSEFALHAALATGTHALAAIITTLAAWSEQNTIATMLGITLFTSALLMRVHPLTSGFYAILSLLRRITLLVCAIWFPALIFRFFWMTH